MNKHAYLIMFHKNVEQLINLVKILEDERNDIYLHVDADSNDIKVLKEKLKSNCSKIEIIDRQLINWGGYSQIKCELRLLKAATMSEVNYARYHLISGMDLPIKSQDYIHAFFENDDQEYIRFDPKPISLYEDRVKYYYFFQDIIGRNHGKHIAVLELLQNNLLKVQRLLKVNRCKKIVLYKGVQWFSITDDFARYVLLNEEFIRKNFKYTLCADEMFLQTLVQMSPYRDRVRNCSLRHIDWERGNPYIFRVEDYEELMNTDNLFARKFDECIDSRIIDMIENEIKNN